MGNKKNKSKMLTGDRPTGPLHLGHFVGSLANRVQLQDKYDCFFIVADYQVLTDHLNDTAVIQRNTIDIVLDWLSVGMDPNKSSFFIQSRVPEIAELTMFFNMLVTVPRLQRNPTLKEEMAATKIGKKELSYGFLGYPISQAADILIVRAGFVPVGEDQLPHLEQTREIARAFNRVFGKAVFPEPEPILSKFSRLPGVDGQKMSKSRNNAIYLKDSATDVEKKVMGAITDPARIHPTDKGHPEICNVFQYYRAFCSEMVPEVEKQCRGGEIGCFACKKRLAKKLNDFLSPIREKRKEFEAKPQVLKDALHAGIDRTRQESVETMKVVKEAMHFSYKDLE